METYSGLPDNEFMNIVLSVKQKEFYGYADLCGAFNITDPKLDTRKRERAFNYLQRFMEIEVDKTKRPHVFKIVQIYNNPTPQGKAGQPSKYNLKAAIVFVDLFYPYLSSFNTNEAFAFRKNIKTEMGIYPKMYTGTFFKQWKGMPRRYWAEQLMNLYQIDYTPKDLWRIDRQLEDYTRYIYNAGLNYLKNRDIIVQKNMLMYYNHGKRKGFFPATLNEAFMFDIISFRERVDKNMANHEINYNFYHNTEEWDLKESINNMFVEKHGRQFIWVDQYDILSKEKLDQFYNEYVLPNKDYIEEYKQFLSQCVINGTINTIKKEVEKEKKQDPKQLKEKLNNKAQHLFSQNIFTICNVILTECFNPTCDEENEDEEENNIKSAFMKYHKGADDDMVRTYYSIVRKKNKDLREWCKENNKDFKEIGVKDREDIIKDLDYDLYQQYMEVNDEIMNLFTYREDNKYCCQ